MENKLTISGITRDDEINENIPFEDMRLHALFLRDNVAAVMSETGDYAVADLHVTDDGIYILEEITAPVYCAMVNQLSGGVGDSVVLDEETDAIDSVVTVERHYRYNFRGLVEAIENASKDYDPDVDGILGVKFWGETKEWEASYNADVHFWTVICRESDDDWTDSARELAGLMISSWEDAWNEDA